MRTLLPITAGTGGPFPARAPEVPSRRTVEGLSPAALSLPPECGVLFSVVAVNGYSITELRQCQGQEWVFDGRPGRPWPSPPSVRTGHLPQGGRQGGQKTCHCEQAQRADVAIRSYCGCIRRRRAAGDSGPYERDSSHSVGADVPIRPESPAPWLPPWGPIPLIKGKCPEGTKGIGILARR